MKLRSVRHDHNVLLSFTQEVSVGVDSNLSLDPVPIYCALHGLGNSDSDLSLSRHSEDTKAPD